MEDIILSAWHGGLGDQLQFSTLPELYTKKGHDVYIEENAPFRNMSIYDFVWGKNPHIKGRKLGKRNAGDIPELKRQKITGSFIRDWEIAHGFKGENDYPKIYVSPNILQGYESTILVDASVISTPYDSIALQNAVLSLKEEYKDKNFCKVLFSQNLNVPVSIQETRSGRHPHNGKVDYHDVYHDTEIYVKDLFDYYNVMYSADGLISLHTGASCMSSTIKNLKNSFLSICLVTEWTIGRDIFFLPNITYKEV